MTRQRTHPDDLVPGAFVTILDDRNPAERMEGPFGPMVRVVDRSLFGVPMCIIQINYPYLLVRLLLITASCVDKHVSDLRERSVMLLDPAFVAGVLGMTVAKLEDVRAHALAVENPGDQENSKDVGVVREWPQPE